MVGPAGRDALTSSMSAGSKADIPLALGMSALPPKADIPPTEFLVQKFKQERGGHDHRSSADLGRRVDHHALGRDLLKDQLPAGYAHAASRSMRRSVRVSSSSSNSPSRCRPLHRMSSCLPFGIHTYLTP